MAHSCCHCSQSLVSNSSESHSRKSNGFRYEAMRSESGRRRMSRRPGAIAGENIDMQGGSSLLYVVRALRAGESRSLTVHAHAGLRSLGGGSQDAINKGRSHSAKRSHHIHSIAREIA
jgi:hypothetical protein